MVQLPQTILCQILLLGVIQHVDMSIWLVGEQLELIYISWQTALVDITHNKGQQWYYPNRA